MSIRTDKPLSDAQCRALSALAEGPVHAGNEHDITLNTVRSLERRGFCTVIVTVRNGVNSWGRSVARRDWTARTT